MINYNNTNFLDIKKFIFVFVIWIFSNPSYAVDCGSLSITNIQNFSLNWSDSTIIQSSQVTIVKGGSSACSAIVGFSTGSSNTYSRYVSKLSETISYQISKSSSDFSNYLKDKTDIVSSTDGFFLEFPEGNDASIQLTYYLKISENDVNFPILHGNGNYTDNVDINVYDQNNLTTARVSSTSSISLSVPSILKLSLVPSGTTVFNQNSTSYTIDLGELSNEKSGSAQLMIKTNMGFQLSAYSLNNRHLVNNLDPLSKIEYSFYYNESLFNLTNVPQFISNNSVNSTINGFIGLINITTTKKNKIKSGTYEDSIFLSVVPY